MTSHDASAEVESTLRQRRDETERQIAVYRVVIFTMGLLVTLILPPLTHTYGGYAGFGLAGDLVYAVGVLLWVRRGGGGRRTTNVIAVCDVVASGVSFVIGPVLGEPIPPEALAYPAFILPTLLLFLLLLNSLRYSVSATLWGGGAALVVFAAVESFVYGFHPAEVPTFFLIATAGWVGYLAAVRARENLERFARLQLLKRYLSPAAVERVLRESPDEALALGGELVTVTLLAADLRDFTAMSEKLAAREVVEQLNEYHGTMLEQIDRHGGVLDKFIGDGTLAVFGRVPGVQGVSADAGAAAAVACARDMCRALQTLNERRGARGQAPLRMGVGIHTGPVIAGNIGAPGRRLEFTVIGDSVNTASRLEGLTKEAGVPVLISGATADRLASKEGLTTLPPMHAKGKQETLEVLAVA